MISSEISRLPDVCSYARGINNDNAKAVARVFRRVKIFFRHELKNKSLNVANVSEKISRLREECNFSEKDVDRYTCYCYDAAVRFSISNDAEKNQVVLANRFCRLFFSDGTVFYFGKENKMVKRVPEKLRGLSFKVLASNWKKLKGELKKVVWR